MHYQRIVPLRSLLMAVTETLSCVYVCLACALVRVSVCAFVCLCVSVYVCVLTLANPLFFSSILKHVLPVVKTAGKAILNHYTSRARESFLTS